MRFNDMFYKYIEITKEISSVQFHDPKEENIIREEMKKLYFLMYVYKIIIKLKSVPHNNKEEIKNLLEQIEEVYRKNDKYFSTYTYLLGYLQHEFDVFRNYLNIDQKLVVQND
jgi:hypothetical protein